MLQESPRDRSLRQGLAQTYMNLSQIHGRRGENESNVEVTSRAIEILEELWREKKEAEIGRCLAAVTPPSSQRQLHGDSDAARSDTRRGTEVLREAIELARMTKTSGGSRHCVPPRQPLGLLSSRNRGKPADA